MAGNIDVLICGAGPTGLVLALQLARMGVRFRIIDAAAEPGTSSRALVVHARTLEFYRQVGIVDEYLAESLRFEAVNMWVRGRHVARAEFAQMGQGLSPYTYSTVCSQDRHERFLVSQLKRHGVEIERSTNLIDFVQTDDRVTVRLKTPAGTEEAIESAYLAGCDGARSRVRDVLDVGFPGGTYAHYFFVADVEATGPVMNNELHVALDSAEFLAVFPLKGDRTGRLIGIVNENDDAKRESLTWNDVDCQVAQRMGIDVTRVNWFSTYRVHHRVANRFRDRRVFLLGDAAHIHSPVGGQGMNTGIGDAVNLAWKLNDVVNHGAPMALLDSYEPERIAFARRLCATTDRAFTIGTSDGWLARFVRVKIVPSLLPLALRFQAIRRFMFRTVSQTSITYRGCSFNSGRLGAICGGDRLPWFEDNFASLDGLRWQVHVYGAVSPSIQEACQALDLPLQVIPWRAAMKTTNLKPNCLYLIRPDGHIALADDGKSPESLLRFMRLILGREPDVGTAPAEG